MSKEINVRKLNLNELYKLYRQDKENYEVVYEMYNQVQAYCHWSLESKCIFDNQELFEQCTLDFWVAISDENEKNINVDIKNYSIVSYFERIIVCNIAKYVEKHTDENGEPFEEFNPIVDDEMNQEDLFFQDNKMKQELEHNRLMDLIVDCLTQKNYSEKQIEWFWLHINGIRKVEIATMYDVSASYITRKINEMLEYLQNNLDVDER